MSRIALALAASFAASIATAPAFAADRFSPAGQVATVTVSFKVTGSGDDIPASHERHVTWKVDDRYDVKATMKAVKPGGYPGLHGMGGDQKADLQKKQDAAQSAAASQSDLMAAAQKAMEKCGENQACMMAEVQKMSKMVDPAKTQATKDQMAIATAPTADRYQIFQSDAQSGTFKATESASEAYFDAACSLKTEAKCRIDTTVAGEGAQTDGAGKTTTMTAAMAEYDAQAGTLVLQLPSTFVGTAEKTVKAASGASNVKPGTTKVNRITHTDWVKDRITVNCGECRSVQGTYTKPVKDALLGRPATLLVEWKFTR